jgi:hypothetical protein
MKAIHLSLVASTFVAVGGACSSSFENASIPPAEDAGPAVDAADAGAEAAVITGAPPGCDATALPTQSDCVVYEGLGVFVSTSLGPQAGDGTRAKPYRTLQQGIDAAKATHKRVYACAETYAESVTLANGVSLFGYFDCAANWTVATTKRAKIAAPTSPAMKAATLPLPVRIEGFEIQAPAGTAQATSSIAVQANDAANLRFVNAKIVAQKAADGANGVEGVQLANGAEINGEANVPASLCNLASCFVVHGGGVGGTNTCVGATGFTGGAGGHGGYGGHWTRAGSWTMVEDATNGEDGAPSYGLGGTGGTQSVGALAGHVGIDGANGASSTGGSFGAAGFSAGAGAQGGHGSPGQGGGGGTGYPPNPANSIPQGEYYGSSGAGGGAGGCPGVAGTPGQGGGASIGVYSWNSALHFEGTTIGAADAGKGGLGTWGSLPTGGGVGGERDIASSIYCGAGGGAPGGRSGVSGHGAGGHSIGIAYKGTAPDVSTDSTITIGAAGLGQSAQQKVYADITKNIGASPAGQAKTQFVIP